MRKITFSLLWLVLADSVTSQKLEDGTYSVSFTRPGQQNYTLNIQGLQYVQYFTEKDSVKGTITWLSSDRFQFDYFKQAADSNTLAGLLQHSFGNLCIELGGRWSDTIPFRVTYSANLHISSSEGYFIRKHAALSDASDDSTVFYPADLHLIREPQYPGGTTGWLRYVHSNLMLPDTADGNYNSATMRFIVNKDGTVSNVSMERGDPALKIIFCRLIEQSGRWIPAQVSGRMFKAYKKVNIIYDRETEQ